MCRTVVTVRRQPGSSLLHLLRENSIYRMGKELFSDGAADELRLLSGVTVDELQL